MKRHVDVSGLNSLVSRSLRSVFVLSLVLCILGVSCTFADVDNPRQTPEEIIAEVSKLADIIEEGNPTSQADAFRLRILAQALSESGQVHCASDIDESLGEPLPVNLEIYKKINSSLDALEQNNPLSRVELDKMRALTEKLLKTKEWEPSRKKSNHQTHSLQCNSKLIYQTCESLRDESLKEALKNITQPQQPIGYTEARGVIFSELDNHNGEVECVYTGKVIKTNNIPANDIMNVEHSWPQSLGASGIAKSDLHHLFPTDSRANNVRANHPFGWVENPKWSQGGSSSDGQTFQVRSVHRGNVARAMFYFSVRYGMKIDNDQEKVLREWHAQDPVSTDEHLRNDKIEKIQKNRNPFVDHPELVDSIKDF